MATRRNAEENTRKKRPPATTPEGRENQLVALAYDLAEKQLRDGTASSQVMTQFLRMGTQREMLEREKIQADNKLAIAKIEAMAAGVRTEEMYAEALAAMKSYAGQEEVIDDY